MASFTKNIFLRITWLAGEVYKCSCQFYSGTYLKHTNFWVAQNCVPFHDIPQCADHGFCTFHIFLTPHSEVFTSVTGWKGLSLQGWFKCMFWHMPSAKNSLDCCGNHCTTSSCTSLSNLNVWPFQAFCKRPQMSKLAHRVQHQMNATPWDVPKYPAYDPDLLSDDC
jgi:hypothetical protein